VALSTFHGSAQAVMVQRLRPPAGDSTKRGCLYFWGRGNTAAAISSAAYWNGTHRAVAELGVPVATGDYSSSTHWGNDAAITSVAAVRTNLNTVTPKTDKVVIVAISLGALLALNWARQNLSLVAAIALITPAVDLMDVHDNTPAYASEIEARYTDLAGLTAGLSTHSPVVYGAQLAGIPIRNWYSTDDTVCRPSTQTAFAAASGATNVSLGAVGHGPGALTGNEVASFLAPYTT
jgi:pimeloyl-ACP methyl ester carboxylesterase